MVHFTSDQAGADVTLVGELDLSVVALVRSRLDALGESGIVDMRGVTYLDSTILTELARVARRVGPKRVTLLVESRFVRRVLRLVKFEELFAIFDDETPYAAGASAS